MLTGTTLVFIFFFFSLQLPERFCIFITYNLIYYNYFCEFHQSVLKTTAPKNNRPISSDMDKYNHRLPFMKIGNPYPYSIPRDINGNQSTYSWLLCTSNGHLNHSKHDAIHYHYVFGDIEFSQNSSQNEWNLKVYLLSNTSYCICRSILFFWSCSKA